MNYTEYIAENIDKSMQYNEYIAEHLDNAITYTEYIADSLNTLNDISYSDYIAPEIDNIIFSETDIGDFITGKYDQNLKISYAFDVQEFFYDENIKDYYENAY
jgi:hypothetical protein